LLGMSGLQGEGGMSEWWECQEVCEENGWLVNLQMCEQLAMIL